MKQNLHTHSIFCDGKDTIEEMTLEAISKGFDILGFSMLKGPLLLTNLNSYALVTFCGGKAGEFMENGGKEYVTMETLKENFDVRKEDGNDMKQVVEALDSIPDSSSDIPTVIISNTVKGKGVSFMENAVDWHGKAPNDAE